MDVFAEHGIAGVVGLIFNALFASSEIIALDGVNAGVMGGWLDKNYKQLYIQVAFIVASAAYTFVMSAAIAYAVDKVPGLKLRASEEAELLGMDDDQLGEFAYDYVEVRRDYLAWTPAGEGGSKSEVEVAEKDRHGIPGHANLIVGEEPNQGGSRTPSRSRENTSHGNEQTGIQGVRHGVAVHDQQKEERIANEKTELP